MNWRDIASYPFRKRWDRLELHPEYDRLFYPRPNSRFFHQHSGGSDRLWVAIYGTITGG